MKPMTIHLEELTSDAPIQNVGQMLKLSRSDKVGCSRRIAIHFHSICSEMGYYPRYLLRYYKTVDLSTFLPSSFSAIMPE